MSWAPHSRFAVGHLVVALVVLHAQRHAAHGTLEALLVPYLQSLPNAYDAKHRKHLSNTHLVKTFELLQRIHSFATLGSGAFLGSHCVWIDSD